MPIEEPPHNELKRISYDGLSCLYSEVIPTPDLHSAAAQYLVLWIYQVLTEEAPHNELKKIACEYEAVMHQTVFVSMHLKNVPRGHVISFILIQSYLMI